MSTDLMMEGIDDDGLRQCIDPAIIRAIDQVITMKDRAAVDLQTKTTVPVVIFVFCGQ